MSTTTAAMAVSSVHGHGGTGPALAAIRCGVTISWAAKKHCPNASATDRPSSDKRARDKRSSAVDIH